MGKNIHARRNKSHKYYKNVTNQVEVKKSFIAQRVKSFIVDMFMIMMPILYVTTYFLMSGKEEFQNSELARWATAAIFGFIIVVFWKITGQTPGLKAYELKVVDTNSLQNITFFQSISRYLLFILGAISIIGLFLPFFRDDKKMIHDILTNTTVISTEKA